MWLYFNNKGQLLETLEHGSPARVGTNDFEIFAYFEGVNIQPSSVSAVLNLRKPDLNRTELASNSLIEMEKDDREFELGANEHSLYFQDGESYYGFYYHFADYEEGQEPVILLDTPGLWESILTILSSNNGISVQGIITFNVENGNVTNAGTNNIDLSQSRNGYNILCKWWSRDERDVYSTDELIMKRVPSGNFWAKEITGQSYQHFIAGGSMMFNKSTISIKTPDNVWGIKNEDLVEYKGEKWLVVNVQKKIAKTGNSVFAADNVCSYYWYIELRR